MLLHVCCMCKWQFIDVTQCVSVVCKRCCTALIGQHWTSVEQHPRPWDRFNATTITLLRCYNLLTLTPLLLSVLKGSGCDYVTPF